MITCPRLKIHCDICNKQVDSYEWRQNANKDLRSLIVHCHGTSIVVEELNSIEFFKFIKNIKRESLLESLKRLIGWK